MDFVVRQTWASRGESARAVGVKPVQSCAMKSYVKEESGVQQPCARNEIDCVVTDGLVLWVPAMRSTHQMSHFGLKVVPILAVIHISTGLSFGGVLDALRLRTSLCRVFSWDTLHVRASYQLHLRVGHYFCSIFRVLNTEVDRLSILWQSVPKGSANKSDRRSASASVRGELAVVVEGVLWQM
jgi:hypothetical protein